jgi:hypothetical protein
MAKAGAEPSTSSWEKLPLDSPDWMPIGETHRLLCGFTGNRHLAANDLTGAMLDEDETRRLPAMRRCFAYGIRQKADGNHERVLLGPERELLPREYWIKHEVQSWSDATFVTEHSRTPASIKGYAYFVWKPALARRWPTVFGATVAAPHKVMSTTDWLEDQVKQAREAEEIFPGITECSRIFEKRMQKDLKLGRVTEALEPRTIEHKMRDLGLWPIHKKPSK